jgi:hypothetical protein
MASIEAAEAPAVETFTEGRDSSPPSAEPSAAPQTNGHDRSEPTTIQGWREERKKAREDAEARATAKAEVDKLSDEGRLALSRKTTNPLYAEHDLAQDLDPAEIERLGLQDAKPPPSDAEDEIAELEARYETLPPEAKGSALGRIAELRRQASETKRAEIEATARNVQRLHEQELAAYNAQHTHLNVVDATMQANFQQMYGVPMTLEGIEYLQATQPELAPSAMQAMLMRDSQMREAETIIAQQQYQDHVAKAQWAGVQDQQFAATVQRDYKEHLVDGKLNPELKPYIYKAARDLFGVSEAQLNHYWVSDPEAHDLQRQFAVLDRAIVMRGRDLARNIPKTLPPVSVQRPGEPTGSRSTHLDDRISALELKGDRSGLSLREASKLNAMKIRRERG